MQLAQLSEWTHYLEWFLKSTSFNIFLSSLESPTVTPRVIQAELREKIIHSDDNVNITFTRAGSIIVSTKVIECAIDVSSISEFLSVPIANRMVWENIMNRFLLFNISVQIALAELGRWNHCFKRYQYFGTSLIHSERFDTWSFPSLSHISWLFSPSWNKVMTFNSENPAIHWSFSPMH